MSDYLKPFRDIKGGYFDVGKTELDKHIGRKVLVKRSDNSFLGRRVFEIREVQKIYDGSLAFRVYQCEDLILSDSECEQLGEKPGYVYPANCPAAEFGQPARPEEVIFLDEVESE